MTKYDLPSYKVIQLDRISTSNDKLQNQKWNFFEAKNFKKQKQIQLITMSLMELPRMN